MKKRSAYEVDNDQPRRKEEQKGPQAAEPTPSPAGRHPISESLDNPALNEQYIRITQREHTPDGINFHLSYHAHLYPVFLSEVTKRADGALFWGEETHTLEDDGDENIKWKFEARQFPSFRKDGVVSGEILFGLWTDESFAVRIADTGWQPFTFNLKDDAPAATEISIAETLHTANTLRFKVWQRAPKYPAILGCSVRGSDGAIIDLPTQKLYGSETVLYDVSRWKLKGCSREVRKGPPQAEITVTITEGQIIFALWEDDSFTNRYADTGWIPFKTA